MFSFVLGPLSCDFVDAVVSAAKNLASDISVADSREFLLWSLMNVYKKVPSHSRLFSTPSNLFNLTSCLKILFNITTLIFFTNLHQIPQTNESKNDFRGEFPSNPNRWGGGDDGDGGGSEVVTSGENLCSACVLYQKL
jgi:hypothetical protein